MAKLEIDFYPPTLGAVPATYNIYIVEATNSEDLVAGEFPAIDPVYTGLTSFQLPFCFGDFLCNQIYYVGITSVTALGVESVLSEVTQYQTDPCF